MSSICAQCSASFEITSEDQRFLTQFQVPAPKCCPQCRLQRRLCERNTRSLYYRKCDLSGKQIIAQYNTNLPFPVYGIDEWLSDRWDALSYGRPFDFARPFSDQFKELLDVTPHLALFNTPGTMENSDFNNCTGYLKNCYLLSESDYCEDSYYSNLLKKSRDVVDCSVCYECERCYECIDCIGCHTLLFSQDCHDCSDSSFLMNCHGCRDCIACINLRNAQYMIGNEQYSKDEFERKKQDLHIESRKGLAALAHFCRREFLRHPFRALITERTEDCVGDRLYDCKRAVHCFDCKDIEDCRHCQRLSLSCKSCMDFNSWGQSSELVYQCAATGDRVYNSKFCSTCITISNCDYCVECFHCRDCFGCVGLQNKQHCIFNVQYAPQEYADLRSTIISHMRKTGEWGEYFPMHLCAFAYNESFAPDLFPLSKEEVLTRGWRWYEGKDVSERYLGADVALPDVIDDTSDDLCKGILRCKATGKPYKIIPQELRYYRSMHLPVPELCPDERHRQRVGRRNRYELSDCVCGKCGSITATTYSKGDPRMIYCERCYLGYVH